jgi:hypothetical protein
VTAVTLDGGAASPSLKKRLRAAGKRAWLWLHESGLRLGVFVLPRHYYVPLPDLRELRRHPARWTERSALRGVAVDLDRQLTFLRTQLAPYEPEYRGAAAFRQACSGAFGPGYGYIESQALHGFIRATRPARVIEIGSGVSTYCMLQALAANATEGSPGRITCIEPYPSAWLREAPVQLIVSRVEDIPLATFDALRPGDLLFVDSTHALRVGGDVLRIVLEILPRLAAGVNVHLHDIYLPFDYQRDADRSLFQWLETALLHAFLIGNRGVEILACLSHLHYDRPEQLAAVFPDYRAATNRGGLGVDGEDDTRHFPSSIYLTIRAADA